MNKERELLKRWLSDFGKIHPDVGLIKDTKELLAQPEQEPKFNFDLERMKAAIESPISDVTVDDLAKQTEQEPVAWQFRTFHGEYTVCPGWDVWEHCTEQKFNNVSEHVTKGFYQVRKLYTAPPKREPLSEEAVSELLMGGFSTHLMDLVRMVEKAHGIGGGE